MPSQVQRAPRAEAALPRSASAARAAPPQDARDGSWGAAAAPAFRPAARARLRSSVAQEAPLLVGVRDAASGEVVCRPAAVATVRALRQRLCAALDVPRLRGGRLAHGGRPLGDGEALQELLGSGARGRAVYVALERTGVAAAAEEAAASETEAGTSDESDAEAQEVQFEPRGSSVQLRSSRSSRSSGGHPMDAEVLSAGGGRRAARLRVGRDGLVVEEEGRRPGQERVRHQVLMLPSVRVYEQPGLASSAGHTVLTVAGAWPAPEVSVQLPKAAARQLQETLLGLVRKVTASLHQEVRFEVPPLAWGPGAGGSAERVYCRGVRARGPLLCAGYVLYSSLAEASRAHGAGVGPGSAHPLAAESVPKVPRYSLCYMELCGPTRTGDARAYLFSSHVDGEAALLHWIIWPSAEDSSFKLIRRTENTVLHISSAEQAWVEPGTQSRTRRSWTEPSRPSWEVPMADCLAFRSALEARAWMDLAASVYAAGATGQQLRDRVARSAATTEGDIRLELTRGKTALMAKRKESVAPLQEAPVPTDPQAVLAREHIRNEGNDVARLVGQMQLQMQLPEDFAGSDSVVFA